jgi:hypothetical protein
MSSHDFFPPFEVGPFYLAPEEDRWDEPEIIVDPLSGLVVAIVRPAGRPVRPEQRERRAAATPSLWRAKLARWLRLAGVSTALMLFAGLPSHAEQNPLNVSCNPTRELYADYNNSSPSAGRAGPTC